MTEDCPDETRLTERFSSAFSFAFEIHAGQYRKATCIPYIAHVMSVSALVLEYGGSEDAAIAGLLHDTIEDSEDGAATEEHISREFGLRMAQTVRACSDTVAEPGEPKPPWKARKEAYLVHLRDETDPDVLLVSACDKLHNVRAITADLRSIGPKVWERFSQKDPEEQLWYYRSLQEAYYGKIPQRLWADLNQAVTEMQSLAGAGTSSDKASRP